MTVVSDYRALLSNNSWAGAPGQAVILTYSFSSAPTADIAASNPGGAATFHALTEDEKATVRAALAQWSAVSGITFYETKATTGDLTFGFYDLAKLSGSSGEAGLGNYPSTGTYVDGGAPQVYSNFLTQGGDVYFDNSYQTNPQYFGDFAHIAVHEIGHALGLKHPFDENPQPTGSATPVPSFTLAAPLDNGSETVMAYAGVRSAWLGPLDIAAIEYLYGMPGTAAHPYSATWVPGTESMILVGGSSAQSIFGSGGNDVFYSMGAADALSGGEGDDLFYADGRPISINGGPGVNTVVTGLTYSTLTVPITGTGTGVRYIALPAFTSNAFQIYINVATLEFTDGFYDLASDTFTSYDAAISPGTTNHDSYVWAGSGSTGSGGTDWGLAANWTDVSYFTTLLPPGVNDRVTLVGGSYAAAPRIITGLGDAASATLDTGYVTLSGGFGFNGLNVGVAGTAGLGIGSGQVTVVGQATVTGGAATVLTVSAGAVLQAFSLVVHGLGALQYALGQSFMGEAAAPTVVVAGGVAGGTLEVGRGLSSVAGALTVDYGGVLSGSGTIAAAVVNNGSVQAAGGALGLALGVSGAGSLVVTSDGDLVLTGALGQATSFAGKGGRLDLVNPLLSTAQAGVITGFAPGDTIAVTNDAGGATAVSYQASGGLGTLVLSRGGTVLATLQLAGIYVGSTFQVAALSASTAAVTVAGPVDPLFDAAYYLAHNPDVAAAGVDPYTHYMTTGWKEGRNPDAFFDTSFYLKQNADVKAAGVNPLAHFEASGWREGRQPSLLFSTTAYLTANPDVLAAGVNPLVHYLQNGQAEGRRTTLAFYDGKLSAADPLVSAASVDAQLGATLIPTGSAAQAQASEVYHGGVWRTGVNPDAWFDTNYYLAQNADVRAAGLDPLLHFETTGWREGREPSLAFSDSKYLASNADVKAAGVDPLLHFVMSGQAEGRVAVLAGGTAAADPLVNAGYYDAQLGAAIVPAGTPGAQQAAWSYDATGWKGGLNPDAWFNTAYYLSHNPDVAAAHINPLLHYETSGWREGRDPSAQFSTKKYLAAYADVKAAGVDPLLHYVVSGQAEGRVAFSA